MSATDELRRLLDDRGVDWWEGDDERKTLWESNGLTWEYFNDENGDAWLGFLGACEQDITPEQAIAATLGGGECEMARYSNGLGYIDEWQCSECGADVGGIAEDTPPNYCPNCGRKAVKR